MKAGITIDDWKLPIFEKHLKEGGFTYEVLPGLTKDTKTLVVTYTTVGDLYKVAKAANNECSKVQAQVAANKALH